MNLKKMPRLSERLKYLRQYFNLSQAELAEIAGTTQQAIQQAEKGKARQPRYLHKLAKGLDVPVDWMIFGDASPPIAVKGPKTIRGLKDRSSDVLQNFYAMPEKDQQLIYELMKSRQKK